MAQILQFPTQPAKDEWYAEGEIAFDDTFLSAMYEMIRRRLPQTEQFFEADTGRLGIKVIQFQNSEQ